MATTSRSHCDSQSSYHQTQVADIMKEDRDPSDASEKEIAHNAPLKPLTQQIISDKIFVTSWRSIVVYYFVSGDVV